MAKPRSSQAVSAMAGRVLKAVMVACVLPLPIGLSAAVLGQLDLLSASGGTVRDWLGWGFATYVGIHVLLYRPQALFRASHQLFSVLAVWLFGGQVASTEGATGARSAGGTAKRAKGGESESIAQGSTLVAFSPYVVPVAPLLACVATWLLSRWVAPSVLAGPAIFTVGLAAAFHWLMTADALQQQRARWHVETYLLAITLVFLLTLVLGVCALPLAVPDLALSRAFVEGWRHASALYQGVVQQLFF